MKMAEGTSPTILRRNPPGTKALVSYMLEWKREGRSPMAKF